MLLAGVLKKVYCCKLYCFRLLNYDAASRLQTGNARIDGLAGRQVCRLWLVHGYFSGALRIVWDMARLSGMGWDG